MSDINEMARSTAHVILAECARQPGHVINIEAQLADVFKRGALWAMTRAAHAVAITHAAALHEPAAYRDGIVRAQAAVAATHQRMLDP